MLWLLTRVPQYFSTVQVKDSCLPPKASDTRKPSVTRSQRTGDGDLTPLSTPAWRPRGDRHRLGLLPAKGGLLRMVLASVPALGRRSHLLVSPLGDRDMHLMEGGTNRTTAASLAVPALGLRLSNEDCSRLWSLTNSPRMRDKASRISLESWGSWGSSGLRPGHGKQQHESPATDF